MVNRLLRCFPQIGLLLGLAGSGCTIPPEPAPPVPMVKPVFMITGESKPVPMEQITSLTLIRYARREQDPGVTVQRWAGDTGSRYKYVEIDRRELKPSDFSEGLFALEPGFYQFKHNSVSGWGGERLQILGRN